MTFINGLALPSMPPAKKPSNEIIRLEPPVQRKAMPSSDLTPPDQRIQYIECSKERGDITTPNQRIEYLPRPVYGPSITLLEAQFGMTAQDAMRMGAHRQQESLARMQQVQQTQLSVLGSQKKKQKKKLPGVRMICLRCKRDKPVNQKNDGITCTECIRKRKREESLALISSPPKAQGPANEMLIAQQEAMAMECDMGNPYPENIDFDHVERVNQDENDYGEGMAGDGMEFFF